MTSDIEIKQEYRNWLKTYREHVKKSTSKKLARNLIAKNFNKKLWTLNNIPMCKQIKFLRSGSVIAVASMKNRNLQIYSTAELASGKQVPLFTKTFSQQVIELTCDYEEKRLFLSLSNFEKDSLKDKVVCLDTKTFQVIFEYITEGKYTKHITYHPDNLLIVSHWRSNTLSILDISTNIPRLIQNIPCGISPRGTAVTKDGLLMIATSFRSRNITYFEYEQKARKFKLIKIGSPIDYPNYSGTPRHIVISEKNNCAFVSNLGRNLLHVISLDKLEIVKDYCVGAAPNTIVLSDNEKYLAISCRESNIICILDCSSGKLETILNTGEKPTGLDFVQSENNTYYVYYSSFNDATVCCRKIIL